jgi:uncharacterized protein with HEPN domain
VSRSDDLRLQDIIEASERIARIIARGRGAFREDEAVQPALERLLEVIGESANALSEDARSAVANTAWDDVRRLRILLAHHYHRVDADQVWSIATRDVPALATSILVARPDLQP